MSILYEGDIEERKDDKKDWREVVKRNDKCDHFDTLL